MRHYKQTLEAAIKAAKESNTEITVVSYIDDFGYNTCGYGPTTHIRGLFGTNIIVLGTVSADGKFTKTNQKQ